MKGDNTKKEIASVSEENQQIGTQASSFGHWMVAQRNRRQSAAAKRGTSGTSKEATAVSARADHAENLAK